MVPVACNVVTIDGFSGHSDRRQLMDYVKALNPTLGRLFVIMETQKHVMHFVRDLEMSLGFKPTLLDNLETLRLK